MGEKKGFFGGIFENDTLLWFIILFLLLFWSNGGFYGGYKE
ncbi:hypothetical protein V6C42_01260 [Pseudoclostridium thermosuccinogenes]|nr:hypothetical protein [Pseudoclostridium thermosuccinogenes]